MLLSKLLSYINYEEIIGETNKAVISITMDSRNVQLGSLFFAIKGYTVDGHDFISKAIDNGAKTIVSEKKIDVPTDVTVVIVQNSKETMDILSNIYYGEPSSKMKIFGVTGTNGKTTVSNLIEKILLQEQKNNNHSFNIGVIGTIETRHGNIKVPSKNTTPESIDLQKLFYEMLNNNVKYVSMEVSSHALSLNRTAGVEFDVALFTNLTQDHLDFHENMEEYRNAKGLLFSQLSEKSCAILNSDDEASNYFASITKAKVLTYGIKNKADIVASNISITSKGTSFDVSYFGKNTSIDLKMIGMFNVYNALAAISACLSQNISMEVIKFALENIKGVPGRFESINRGQDYAVVVDYAHTPDSLENVLKTAKEFTKGNIYCVVGCGGNRDTTKRPIMARVAADNSYMVILTSDNPRSENPVDIIEDMKKGLTSSDNHVVFIERTTAIGYAIKNAKKGDCVIIAGKGHETYQIIGSETIHFDDREKAIEEIENKLPFKF